MIPVSKRHELSLRRSGSKLVAGVDEAGIGPLAGPVVAAAVIMKEGVRIRGLDDSKKLKRQKREELFSLIADSSISIGIGIVDCTIIDKVNVLQASFQAIRAAVSSLTERPDHVLVDGIRKVPAMGIPQTCVKHGDRISSAIATASILAKVVRDNIMDLYDKIYPNYMFSNHKGYGTKLHMKLLKKYGPSPIHRLTYEPVHKTMKRHGHILA